MPNFETIQSITVVGAGHCGRQIAYLLGKAGLQVTCYEPNEEQLNRAKTTFCTTFWPGASQVIPGLSRCSTVETTPNSIGVEKFCATSGIRWTKNISVASQSDLLIEATPESLPLKRSVMEAFAKETSAQTILATNSSYLLPSSIFRGLPHPERFAALHFHVPLWYATAVDVMPAPRTTPEVLSRLVELVERLGLDPILMRREFPGYVFNNLLNPLLVKAMELAERQVCSPDEIEHSWKSITQMPVGPFGMMLQIGLPSLRTILESAVSQIHDPSTLRAYRFIQQWDGQLSGNPTSKQPSTTTSPSEMMSHLSFKAYEVVWNKTRAFDPKQDELVRRIRVVFQSNDVMLNIRELAKEQIYIWPFSFPSYSSDLQQSLALAITDPSAEMVSRLLSLKRWQQVQTEQRTTAPTLLISLRSTNLQSDYGFAGSTGLIRALWLEQMAIQPAEGSHLTNGQRSSSIQLLEIDLNSIAQPSADNHSSKNSSDEPDQFESETLAYAFAHTHQRYQAGIWQIPKLRRLSVSASWTPAKQLLDNSRWLISGGGRGITAQLALILGLHGATLEIIGRTAIPEIPWHERTESEIKEARLKVLRDAAYRKDSIPAAQTSFDAACELSYNIAALQQNGIDFRYHQVDVSDRDGVWSLFESLRKQGVKVNGFLHGAGFEQTSLLWKKSADSIAKTIESKVRGSLNLQSLINKETRWFIQCGSLSGFFGGIGQVDYAAANCFLAEQAQSRKEEWPNMQSLTIAWPGWEQMGMAARTSSKWALVKAGHKRMSIAEGSQHFLSLIEKQVNGLVLICNPDEIPNSLLTTNPL